MHSPTAILFLIRSSLVTVVSMVLVPSHVWVWCSGENAELYSRHVCRAHKANKDMYSANM